MGKSYIERGREPLRAVKDEDAKATFARALQRDPSAGARINTAWANTFVDRGKKPLGQGNDEAAKAAFEEALRFETRPPKRRSMPHGRTPISNAA